MNKRELIAVLRALLEALVQQETPPPRLAPPPERRRGMITERELQRGFRPHGEPSRQTLSTGWLLDR
jgi:hypothetical protein